MRTIFVSPEFPLNRRMRRAVRRGKLRVVREGGERLSLGGGMAVEARRAVRTFSSPLVCMADSGAEVGGAAGGMENCEAGMDYVANELGRREITASPIGPPNRNFILSVRKADGVEFFVWVKTRQESGKTVMLDREGCRVNFDFLVILTNFQSESPDVYVLTADETRRHQHRPADTPRRQSPHPKRDVLRERDYSGFAASPEEGWEKIARTARG